MRQIGRVGLFFLFLGVILLVLFIGTEQVNQPQYPLCFAALVVLALGTALILREAKPAQPVERFRLLRQFRQKKAKEQRKE